VLLWDRWLSFFSAKFFLNLPLGAKDDFWEDFCQIFNNPLDAVDSPLFLKYFYVLLIFLYELFGFYVNEIL